MENHTDTLKLSFEEATDELETIIQAIESGDVPIDALLEKVERASRLIRHCRKKIVATEQSVEKLVESLDERQTEED